MNNLEILDLLSNDVKVVDATVRAVDDKRGIQNLRFPGNLMPDGRPLDAEVPKELNPTILKEWCNAVRREYDARQRRKEDQEARNARAVAESADGAGAPTREHVPNRIDPPKGGEEIEKGLEESLKAEIVKWARAERREAEEVARLTSLADAAKLRHASAESSRVTAERVMQFYLDTVGGKAVAPKNSRADSK